MSVREHRTCMQCNSCVLKPRRWRPAHGGYEMHDRAVFGAGSFKSGVAFIGEAPGDSEVSQGAPLVGPTGWWFRCVLADAGLNYDDVWRTNALLCQPTGKGSELKGVNWKAVKNCGPSLQEEIRWLIQNGIKALVPMGNAALQAVLPGCEYSITQARGYVFPLLSTPSIPVIPTLHPSPKNLKGSRDGWTLVATDMRKAARIAQRGVRSDQCCQRIINPTKLDLFHFFSHPRPMAYDVENTADGRLVVLGACDGQQTLVTPFLSQYGVEYWGTSDRIYVDSLLRDVMADEAWPKWFQNGIHDTTILERNGMPVKGWVHDTMLSHHACYPAMNHSLHVLGSLYCERPPWKPAAKRPESAETEETK